jgi:sec-independent protein translocase protein TatA
MLGGLGWQELVIVLIIVIIIFGAGRLPEIGGAVGKSIKEFRNQSAEEEPGEIAAGTTTTSDRASSSVSDAKSSAQREVRAEEI